MRAKWTKTGFSPGPNDISEALLQPKLGSFCCSGTLSLVKSIKCPTLGVSVKNQNIPFHDVTKTLVFRSTHESKRLEEVYDFKSLAKSLTNQMTIGHKTSEALGSRTQQNRPQRPCGQGPSSPTYMEFRPSNMRLGLGHLLAPYFSFLFLPRTSPLALMTF